MRVKPGTEAPARTRRGLPAWLAERVRPRTAEGYAPAVFLMPAVLVVLGFSIFPIVLSAYLSLSRFQFVRGGFELRFIGLFNYEKLLFGSQQEHFLGRMAALGPVGYAFVGALGALLAVYMVRYLRSGRVGAFGLVMRSIMCVGVFALGTLTVFSLAPGGLPGTLVTTLVYVFVGVAVQFLLGLGLALLCVQRLPGRRFFRVAFFLPLMITPVGIAYTFRMLTDLSKGPFTPIWRAMGLAEMSWVSSPWGARIAVMIGDAWQWIPFMFIVLLASLEGQDQEQVEAARVDGANGLQIFHHITWPALVPVSGTLVLIRIVEAFKIVDIPNVLTNGGPGTASESLTLQAFIAWRTLDLGGSAAVAYLLLFTVTFCTLSVFGLLRARAARA